MGQGLEQGETLSIQRPSGKHPFLLHITPIPKQGIINFPDQPAAMVLVSDPGVPHIVTLDSLVKAFSFTATEAKVAQLLASGQSPNSIAAQLEIGIGTVRTHLRAIFRKANCNGQVEFLSLVARLQ